MSGGDMYSLKWNHYHTYLTSGLAQLIDDSEYSMTDVNLACEGQFIQAHKLILSLCSPFFKQLFRINRMEKSNYINVVLTGVKFKDLKNILHFIYHGEVNVGNSELNNFLQAAEVLQIEGLAGGVENNQQDTVVLNSETKKPTASVLASQGPPPSVPTTATSSLITHNNGAPPNKRSRLSVSTSSNNMSNATLSTSRLGSQTSQISHHSATSMSTLAGGMLSNTIIESGNQASAIASDPLEDDGAIEECGEEMISLDSMKSEPIAVYTITENNAEGDEINVVARNSTTRHHGAESDGMLYDFESHVIQSSSVGGPGPSSSSAIMRPRMSGVQKPDIEECKVPDTYHQLDNFQMRCKKCGENVPSDSFQTHGCYSSQFVRSQAIGIVQPVQCTICLKTFKNRNSLKVHKSTYHRPKETATSGMRLSHLAEIITTSTPLTSVATESPVVKTYPSAASSSHQPTSMMRNECSDKPFQLQMYAQPQTLLALLHPQQSYNEDGTEDKKPLI